MRANELIRYLNERGIYPYIEAGRLKTRSDAAITDPDVIAAIRDGRDALIAFLDDADAGATARAITPVPDREAPAPLSFAQQRLWFIDRLESGSAHYNINVPLTLRGVLDTDALQASLDAIVARHEVLRTRFAQGAGGEVLQYIDPPAPVPVEPIDLEALDATAQADAVAAKLQAESACAFDLATGPLMRTTVLRLAPQTHILLLAMHHIVSDGWSKGIMLRELCTLYAGFHEGRPPALPALPIQYRDYAAWQRASLQGEALDRHLDWWKQHLVGAPAVHALPLSRRRPAEQVFHGGMHRHPLAPATVARLRTLCQREGMTPFTVLQAAFALLVARFSGEDDVVLGTPVSGRNHPDLEPLVGFFVNTLALRTHIDPSQSFAAFVDAAKATVLDAFHHQDVPFELVVDAVNPTRSLSYSPLFQLLFSFHGAGGSDLRLPGLEIDAPDDAGNLNQFDIEFNVSDDGDAMAAAWSYNRALFDADAIERLADGFCLLLDAALADPSLPVAALPIASSRQVERVVREWNETARPFAHDTCVHALFEAQAGSAPGACAVACGDERLSFADVDAAANRIAAWLVEQGVTTGQRVGLCLPRSTDLPIALLAVLKAGAAYVPLDPSLPEARLQFMLDDAGIDVVLTHAESWRALDFGDRRVLPLDAAQVLLAGYPDAPPNVAVAPEDPAYVIYTSGSTGRPKGVLVPHRAVLNYLQFAASDYLDGAIAGGVVATPFGFDATVTTLLAPWLVARPAILLADDAHEALEQLLDVAKRTEPHLFKLTPAHLDALAELSVATSATPHVVVVGGEQLTVRTVERFRARVMPHAVIVNEYGPTETVVGCTTFTSRADAALPDSDVVPIGRPIANTQVYVLDGEGRPVPVGVPGELFIGGAGVTAGYLGQPELTGTRFVTRPFTGDARLYRSGDLVRWRADGELEFVGRVDTQAKINGFRIEPGDIEAQLARAPSVSAACVGVRDDAAGRARLVAYVVAEDRVLDTEQDESEIERWRFQRVAALRAWLQASVPDYMVPSAFVLLPALPLTANGKVDRDALPAPDASDFERDAFVAPRTPVEQALAAIWQRVLRLDAIGIDDHFFRLGGHSLLATRVVSEIAEHLQRRIPVRAMFERPTIRALAERIEAAEDVACDVIPVAPRDAALPLSFAQQRLWFVDQLEGGSRQYHIVSALRLRGALDPVAVQRALDAIVARHEVLRTRFVASDGVPRQVIAPAAAAPLRHVDLSTLAPAARETELHRLAREEAGAPFDLAADTLLRAALLRLDPQEHVAVLTMHHIASDGWSTGVLVREFTALYEAFRTGGEDTLPPLPLQYADYAHWQRGMLQGDALERQLAYWRGQLAGLPRTHGLPLDRPRPAAPDLRGGVVEHVLDADRLAALQALANDHGASLFMVLQAAFALTLGRWSDEQDIVIGSPTAGRPHGALEPLIGFFINSLVLRTRLDGSAGFAALLEQARRTVLDAFAHQSVPFDLLVDDLKPERSLNQAPLFQISFTLHNLDPVRLELPGLVVSEVERDETLARYDIELHIGETADGLHVRWIYARSLFDDYTIERLAESFDQVLASAVREPHAPIDALDVLPEADRHPLAQWSGPREVALAPVCAHDLLETHARRDPSALAVQCDGERLTYGELDAEAGRLAAHLRRQGIGRGDLVGLCVERSPEMMIGVLGILKAGAAYVPLDPGYPADRLAAMLDDAGVACILTQQSVLEAVPALADRSVLPLDAEFRAVLFADTGAPVVADAPVPADAAYVIYTSGSTGTPKGVRLGHHGMVNLAHNQQVLFGMQPAHRVLAFASIGFDGAVWEWLMALAHGASLHICTEEDRRSADRLSAFLERERITHAAIPPALLAQVPIERDYALQVLIVAGEACEETLAWAWARRCRVCNSYGPSEATVAATHADILPGHRIELGTALDNVELRVVNGAGRLQPIGVPGELWLGGAGLAHGYIGRPDQAARFVASPFNAGARLYRTGDRVGWTRDGRLQFLGRVDDQIKIRGFRVEPGEIESHLLTHPDVREAVVFVREDGGVPRLVAYLACDSDDDVNEALLAKSLRAHLKQRVPEYMVPAAFVVVDAIPLTRNGKVDRRRLPVPNYQSQRAYVPPETPVQAQLASIWQQVLRVDQVGIHDNFFEIGGDSILSIQVVSRANQAGIAISTKQLFEAQTVAELAACAGSQPEVRAPQAAVEGEQCLLPIHHLFLTGEERDRQHYNQAVLLETPADFDDATLHALVDALYRRHDALRLRFDEEDGIWRGRYRPLDGAMVTSSCIVEPLPVTDTEVTARCTHWQRSFDLGRGPLLRAVHLRAGTPGTSGRLLLLVHHIVVDGVSWRILLADLEQAYAQHRADSPIALPAKTSSFQQWGEALLAHAASDTLHAEKAYWLAQMGEGVPALPVDRVIDGLGEIGTTRMLAIGLNADETRALQQECHQAYRTQIHELLLAGVYLGMHAWTGESALRLRLEGHGREPLFDDIDVTGTVGWFTSVYPLTLSSASASVGDVIRAVKEQCRSIPHRGIGYGLLRYLAQDPDIVAAARSEPELEFNYLGQFDQVLNADTVFQAAPESVGEKIGPRRRRMHQLGLSGKIFGGTLNLVLDYSALQYDTATMERLAALIGDGLREVIAHCVQPDAGAFTPSDFPLATVDTRTLDAWQGRYPALQRLYRATPMQAGLLFESLLAPATYVVQTAPLLRGRLDAAAFREAWQQVVDRHDVFRTAFLDDGRGPHQAVLAHAALPWHEEDWRGLSEDEQTARFDAYLRADRDAGFDFARPPLLRIALFRLADDRHRLLWTQHHILSDGWSSPLVYRDVVNAYHARIAGRAWSPAAPPAFEQYIAWLSRQDAAAALAHWGDVLGDIEAPTTVLAPATAAASDPGGEPSLQLDEADTAALQALARARHTTVNTLVQWAWGYLLHRHTGEDDVVFGATLSGRVPDVPGIEEMVGLFINTVPVRVRFGAGVDAQASLDALQREFQRSLECGHVPLVDIQRQSAAGQGSPLFDSLLVFENVPLDARLDTQALRSELELESLDVPRQTHYPLTLIVNPGRTLHVRLGYRASQAGAAVERIAEQFGAILRTLPRMFDGGAQVELLSDADRRQLAQWHAPVAAYPRDASIHGLVEAQAARTPDAVAVIGGGRRLDYATLDAQANRIAHYLVAHGAGPGDRIGLYIDRSCEFVVGLLAVLKCGAAYVPLDPALPSARLARMIEASGMSRVLTRTALAQDDVLSPLDVVRIDDAPHFAAYPAATLSQCRGGGDAPAFVMFTSGSTGQPKGVELPHRTIVNLMLGLARRHEAMASPLVTTQFASIGFDMSLYEVASALFTGGTLVLVDDDDRLDTRRLLELLRRERVGRIYLPTAMLSTFANALIEADIDLPDLRLLQVAGEALGVGPAVRRWASRARCTLLNLYGPTESHVVSEHLLAGDPASWPDTPPIGRPVDNVALHVLDRDGRRVPVGMPGELYIGGDGLALRYLGDAELTRRRFVDMHVDGSDAQRLYRTGDRVRWRADGELEFLGRLDAQVKLRGQRLEPGEIEAELLRHPDVTDAVVVVAGETSDRYLVGYVVPRDIDAPCREDDLREHLGGVLPAYMVPAAFVIMPALPLTANGKVDRRALPVPVRQRASEFVAPSGATETRLAAIWCALLKLEAVGARDRFFELGGHSLLATQLVSAIRVEFDCVVGIRDVFTHQTIADMAGLIDALARGVAMGGEYEAALDRDALEELEW